MKKTLLSIVIATSGYCAYAQNTFPSSGNVGIGTLAPGHLLEVYSGARRFSAGSDGVVQWNEDGAGGTLTWDTNTAILGSNAATANLSLRPAEVNVMTLQSNGRVGIGTTAPRSNLHIGNAQSSGITLSYDGSDSYRAQIVPYWNSNKDSRIDFNINNSGGITPSTIMSVGYDGNVGIGTITPAEKLSVKGKIRAQEIKVETANWPDYVFSKDYQLPSLQQTEKHIKEKGHLPGIPSASEVKTNGIDLGEMNAKLLQKIEELTLHLIEQNNRLDAQEKEINKLKKN